MRRYVGPMIILLVFAILLLFVLLTQNNNSSSSPTQQAANSTPAPTVNQDLQVLKLATNEAVTGLEIKTVTGTLQIKLDAGQWKETAPTAAILDGAVISDTVQQLSNFTGASVIPADKATNLATFGLDKPSLTVNLQTPSGQKTLLYGALNPASNNYYLKRGDDARVWTVSSFTYNTLVSWVSKPPTPPPTVAITGGPQTPLPTITPSPSPAPSTAAAPSSPGATPAATTAPGTTASGATTAAVTTGPATTTPVVTTAAPATTVATP